MGLKIGDISFFVLVEVLGTGKIEQKKELRKVS
jgi:hypothetical protein